MQRSDVLEALADPSSRSTELEDAFCALVDWPRVDMIRGLAGTEDAVDLLGSVASALVAISDTRTMPGEIAAVLENLAAARGHSIVHDTYYAGALYVQKHLGWWRDVLHAAKTDEAPR